jgi:hypothetical protein
MTVRTISEGDQQITVQVLRRTDVLGGAYWQGRAMFQIAGGHARGDVVTTLRHATVDAAEAAAIALARASGWGRR